MTLKEAHTAFNIGIDKVNGNGYVSFTPEEKDYFLNTAITRLYKTKYSGNNQLRKGFQQIEKRSDDFRNVIAYTDMVLVNKSDNQYKYSFPSDYWFTVGEEVYITSTSTTWPKTSSGTAVTKRVDVTECTIENIDSRLNNSLSDHILNRDYARPLRVQAGNNILLYTDGNYDITKYSIYYIKKPAFVNWNSTESGYSNLTTQLTSVPDHMWDEVIAYAVRLALENISDYRYQTNAPESQLVE